MPRKRKRVLVTGAAGFIGFHAARHFLVRGWQVSGIDSLNDYYDVRLKRRRLALLRSDPGFSFIRGSIAEYPKIEALVRTFEPDCIVHLAGQAGVRYSLKNPWAYAESNYLGTLNVFEAARAAGVKKVVYASSSSVYGSRKGSAPFREDEDTDHSLSIYAATKKANEVLAHSYHHLYGMDMIGLRFFTVYGTYLRPDLALFSFTKRILEGKPITLYNRGNMARSFTYVGDIVPAIEAAARMPTAGYRLYNLGGARPVPLRAFLKLVEMHLGIGADVRYASLQAGDIKETIADSARAKRDLGFRSATSIDEIVREFTGWFLENKKWLLALEEGKQ